MAPCTRRRLLSSLVCCVPLGSLQDSCPPPAPPLRADPRQGARGQVRRARAARADARARELCPAAGSQEQHGVGAGVPAGAAAARGGRAPGESGKGRGEEERRSGLLFTCAPPQPGLPRLSGVSRYRCRLSRTTLRCRIWPRTSRTRAFNIISRGGNAPEKRRYAPLRRRTCAPGLEGIFSHNESIRERKKKSRFILVILSLFMAGLGAARAAPRRWRFAPQMGVMFINESRPSVGAEQRWFFLMVFLYFRQ